MNKNAVYLTVLLGGGGPLGVSAPAVADAVATHLQQPTRIEVYSATKKRTYTPTIEIEPARKDGSFAGRMSWPNFGSVHRIEGKVTGDTVTFRETAYIKKGSAHLNCVYTLRRQGENLVGTWEEPGVEKGTITIAPARASSGKVAVGVAAAKKPEPAKPVAPPKDTVLERLPKSAKVEVVSTKKGGRYTAEIEIDGPGSAPGSFVGKMTWPKLGSVHRIEGTVKDGQLTFRETAAIKKGSAHLNCVYHMTVQGDRLVGTWEEPGADKGTVAIPLNAPAESGAKTSSPLPAARTPQPAAASTATSSKAAAPAPAKTVATTSSAPVPATATKTPLLPAKLPPLPVLPEVKPLAGQGYFKLVEISFPHKARKDETLAYGPKAPRSELTWSIDLSAQREDTDNRGNKILLPDESWGYTLRWSVPEAFVCDPKVPHRFAIQGGTFGAPAGISIPIRIDFGSGDRVITGVRRTPPDRRDREYEVPSDEFELRLPRELADWIEKYRRNPHLPSKELAAKASVRVPSRDLEPIVGWCPGLVDKGLPLSRIGSENEDIHFHAVWAKGIVVRITDHFLTLAEYTYRWQPPDGATDSIEFVTDPSPKQELRADGRDSVVVKARAHATRDEKPAATLARTRALRFSGSGAAAAWVDLSETRLIGDWQCVTVRASNPDPVAGKTNPPPATLQVRAASNDEAGTLELKVAPDAVLTASADQFDFTPDSGRATKIKLDIANAGASPWKFCAEYEKNSRPLATFTLKPADGRSAVLELKDAGLPLDHDGDNVEHAMLNLYAEQKGRDALQAKILVRRTQEGVFLSSLNRNPETGFYKVHADGKARTVDLDFQVFALDAKSGKIVNLTAQAATLKKITVECLEVKTSAPARLLESGKFSAKLAGLRPLNEPTGILRMAFAKELPGDGSIVPCDFRLRFTGNDAESFSAVFTLGIVTTANGPGGKNWTTELERCQAIIDKFVPAKHRPRLQAMLDRRKKTLGAEGLAHLRQKIWNAAYHLTLGEGGKGYADEARWAHMITEVLEWTQWAGDFAFGAALGTYAGPFGASSISVFKGFAMSALDAYQNGVSAEAWLWENLYTIPDLIEGKIVDVDAFERWGLSDKAKAWALYASYHFLKSLYNEQSLVEALKQTARNVSSTVLANWLGEQVKQNKNRRLSDLVTGNDQKKPAATAEKKAPAATPAKPKTPAPGTAAKTPGKTGVDAETDSTKTKSPPGTPATDAVSDAERLVRSRVERGPGGQPQANLKDVLTIMRDPSMVRALKTAPPEVQEAFSNTRERIYRIHDRSVERFVKENVEDMKDRCVKVMEFRTPGATGPSLNTDRDYRVCYLHTDPKTGWRSWVEVLRDKWEKKSYTLFATLTGGPDQDPKAAQEWAAKHQQLATDRGHMEASAAFSDQKTVWNPETRKLEKVQVVANITQVTNLHIEGVEIEDPHSLGRMFQVKVADAHFRHEKFVQANKGVETLAKLRESYADATGLRRDTGSLTPQIQAGMDAVVEVNKQLKNDPNRRDPSALAEAEAKLRSNGFRDIDDFMGKLSGQYESFKWMKPKRG